MNKISTNTATECVSCSCWVGRNCENNNRGVVLLLCRSFVTTELVSRLKNQRGHWVCWISTSRKNGIRTHWYSDEVAIKWLLYVYGKQYCDECFHTWVTTILRIFPKTCSPHSVRMWVSARVRVSARVGVSAQGCGKKAGSKWFNPNTAERSESPHSLRRLWPLRQGWAICPAFCAIKHAVLQGLVSRAPLLYFGPASVGARKQLADI